MPAVALSATIRGRKKNPTVDVALRVTPQAHNDAAPTASLYVIPNMRVPESSPIFAAYQTGVEQSAPECLDNWTTSDRKRLPSVDVFTSARRFGSTVYAVLSKDS